LLSPTWFSVWPNSIQVALQRSLSDHVPLVLFMDEENWGPRPLQMLKCWADFQGYADFVRNRWGSFVLNGWGNYVPKEKLKLIKGSLKECHQSDSQNMEGKLRVVKDRMTSLDSKGESSDLLQEEMEELHELSVSLHSLSRVQSSMCWQKARLTWFQHGDANSKFFHGVMSSRSRRNAIQLIQVNGAEVQVFSHFSSHFKVVHIERPGMEDMSFRRLSVMGSNNLIRPFSLEEVKQTVWDCDSFKSPGLDGISFGFIKQF